MSLRPPSNVKPYDDYYSGDPAFARPAADATEDERKEHAHKITVARDTGDWSALLIEGQQPTKFVMRPLSGTTYRMLVDDVASGKVGSGQLAQLAMRAATKDVVNFGDFEIKRESHPRYGSIATAAFTDALDAIDLSIVTELGGEALRRARDLSPK